MDLERDSQLSARLEHVTLPRHVTTGRYDRKGRPDPRGAVRITTRGTAFTWVPFERPLQPGEAGEMVFRNLPGTFLLGVSFTAWDAARGEPVLSDGLMTLISAERGRSRGRVVGRNTHHEAVHAAVGIVIADDAPYA